jgi:hypothetical protein
MALQPGELDKLGQNVNTFFNRYAQNLTGTPLALLQPGNLARFWNAPNMPGKQWWSVENTVVLGGGQYWGWPLGAITEPALKVKLMTEYNDNVAQFNKDLYAQPNTGWTYWGTLSKVTLSQIRGYIQQGDPIGQNAAWCVNIPALAQAVFNLRTGNQ